MCRGIEARCAASVPSPRHRCARVEPARRWLADRQVPAVETGARRDRVRSPTRTTSTPATSDKFDAVERLADDRRRGGPQPDPARARMVGRAPRRHRRTHRSTHERATRRPVRPPSEITLEPDVLDAIDAVVAPGVDLNPADTGWTPPGLAHDHRRRPTSDPDVGAPRTREESG